MIDPLVTVVTPAYNLASYLEGVIRSVLEQDYPNIEYIVLDDGSKDNTREVLEKYTGRIIFKSARKNQNVFEKMFDLLRKVYIFRLAKRTVFSITKISKKTD